MASITLQTFADAGGKATLIAAKRKGRLFGVVQNVSDKDVAIGFSTKSTFAPGDNAGFVLKPNASISFPELSSNLSANEVAVYGVSSSGTAEVRWIELPTP